MNDGTQGQEMLNQVAGKGLEAMSLWAETNQRVLRELVELGTGTAKESIRLYAELQKSAMDAVRDGQSAALRWQATWTEMASDPGAWYRKAMAESVTGAQHAFRMAEEGATAVTRAAERMQAATEAAGKGIQDTCAGAAAKMKEIYAS
jgi:hypothetical protein